MTPRHESGPIRRLHLPTARSCQQSTPSTRTTDPPLVSPPRKDPCLSFARAHSWTLAVQTRPDWARFIIPRHSRSRWRRVDSFAPLHSSSRPIYAPKDGTYCFPTYTLPSTPAASPPLRPSLRPHDIWISHARFPGSPARHILDFHLLSSL